MNRPLLCLLASLSFSVACGGVVDEPQGDDGRNGNQVNLGANGDAGRDGGTDGSSTPTTPTPTSTSTSTPPTTPTAAPTAAPTDTPTNPPPAKAAQAITRAQSDALWATYWKTHGGDGSSSGGIDEPLDPHDLFLQVSDMGVVCSSPTTELGCGGHWSLTLVLPPALQHPGVYDLESPALAQYSSMFEMGQPYSEAPGDCGGGGGSIGAGTLEILSIDETGVRFHVEVKSPIFEANPSGTYTAPRCPAQ